MAVSVSWPAGAWPLGLAGQDIQAGFAAVKVIDDAVKGLAINFDRTGMRGSMG